MIEEACRKGGHMFSNMSKPEEVIGDDSIKRAMGTAKAAALGV